MIGQHNILSTRDVKGMFYDELQLGFGTSWLSKVCFGPVASDQASETYPWLGMPPAMAASKGRLDLSGQRESSITIANTEYIAAMKLALDFWRRDKTGQLQVRIKQLAARANAHWKTLVQNLILNGGATLCHDGQYFYDDDHSEGSSGTQKNLLTASEVSSLNVGTAAAPTSAEMAQAMLDVMGYMMSYKDDQGEPVNEEAMEWVFAVPFNLYGAARAAATKDILLSSGGGAVSNALKDGAVNVSVVMLAGLSSTPSAIFYPFIVDRNSKAFILQEESIAPEEPLKILGPDSEYAVENGEGLARYKVSRGAGYGHWWLASKCTLS